MNNPLSWDDLRIILAIADTGTLSGAGRRLATSHATVFRHLRDIEQRLGVSLFERARTGYTPTLAGDEAAAAARRIETEVLGVERRLAGRDLRPTGNVRITTTDTLFAGLLSPLLTAFQTAYPDIRLEVAVSNHVFNLTRREADIAIRPSSTPPENLIGRRVGTIAQAIYARRGEDITRIDDAPWVGPDDSLDYRELHQWMNTQGLDTQCRYRIDTVLGLHTAVRDGAGLAVLPCYLADADDQLTRVGHPIPALATELWLLTHPDLRNTARIRAVLDFLAESIKQNSERLAGKP